MNAYENQIKTIILNILKDQPVHIILYGSRATQTARLSSDYDIALKSRQPIPQTKLSLIREKLEASNIPYKIDLVDYALASSELQANIDKEGTVW